MILLNLQFHLLSCMCTWILWFQNLKNVLCPYSWEKGASHYAVLGDRKRKRNFWQSPVSMLDAGNCDMSVASGRYQERYDGESEDVRL